MGVTINRNSVPKLRQAIADGEAFRMSRGGERLPVGPSDGQFSAMITGVTFEQPTGPGFAVGQVRYIYSFIRITPAPDAEADLWVGPMAYKFVNQVAVHRSAIELNNRAVPMDEVVQMSFVGLFDETFKDPEGNPLTVKRARFGFVFQPEQIVTSLPIHDHRDNITGGGFAFAVYHPGTGLPQQPWSL